MKLLIVDDEKHVITALRLLIPAEKLGFSEVLSTQSYLEARAILEKERPEIAIVDIVLQNQTGINLMSFIQSKHLPTKLIAISGHSDYEYVRTMLLNGAVDYLLKPIEPHALQKALKKAIDSLEPAPAPVEAPIEQAQETTRHLRKLLSGLLTDTQDTIDRSFETLAMPFSDLSECSLLFFNTSFFPVFNAHFQQTLSIFLVKIRHMLLSSDFGYLLEHFGKPENYLILLRGENASLNAIEKLSREVFGYNTPSFFMGCSSPFAFPNDFKSAYREAQSCFLSVPCHNAPHILEHRPYVSCFETLRPPEKLLQQMLAGMIVGRESEVIRMAENYLQEILQAHSLTFGMMADLKRSINHAETTWTNMIRAVFPDFTISLADSVSYNSLLDENLLFSLDNLREHLLLEIKGGMKAVTGQLSHRDLFEQIALYLSLLYTEKIDQTEIADLFHINRDYLSRKFKQVFGEGMVNYINRLRIKKAETLLRDSDMKVRDIAFLVGYSDEKYFTKQFRLFLGTSPSEYRFMVSPQFAGR